MEEVTVLTIHDHLVQVGLLMRDAGSALALGNNVLFREQIDIAEEQFHSCRLKVYPSTQSGRSLTPVPCRADHGVDYEMRDFEPDPLVVEFYDELVRLGRVFENRPPPIADILRAADAFELIVRMHFPHTLDRLEAQRISSAL